MSDYEVVCHWKLDCNNIIWKGFCTVLALSPQPSLSVILCSYILLRFKAWFYKSDNSPSMFFMIISVRWSYPGSSIDTCRLQCMCMVWLLRGRCNQGIVSSLWQVFTCFYHSVISQSWTLTQCGQFWVNIALLMLISHWDMMLMQMTSLTLLKETGKSV